MTEKFKKCLWLLRTIFSHPMSYDEINEKWKRSELNIDGYSLPKKSFHNHLQSLQELFGIDIICDRRNGYKYSISVDQINDQLTLDILHKLFLRFAFIGDDSMKYKIMDWDYSLSIPDFYYEVMDAISTHSITKITQYNNFEVVQKEYPDLFDYSKLSKYKTKENYIPLGMIKVADEWYVIGKNAFSGNYIIIRLTNVISVSVTGHAEDKFDDTFSVKQFVEQFEYSVEYLLLVDDDSALFDCSLNSSNYRKELQEKSNLQRT